MRWFRYCLTLAALLGLGAGTARAQTQPPEFLNAYVFGIRAEQAEAAGDPAQALAHGTESLRLYRETARVHPEWKPELVQYRLTATENQLERLRRLVAEQQADAAPTAVEEEQRRLDAALADARAAWDEERTQLVARVAALSADHEALRAALAEAERAVVDKEAEVRRLIDEQASLRREAPEAGPVDQLREERDALALLATNQAVRIAGLEAELSAAQASLGALSNQLAEAVSSAARAEDNLVLEQKTWNAERRSLVERLEAMKETIDLSREDVERVRELRATIKRLEKENRRLTRDAAKLRDEAEPPRNDTP